MKVHAISDLHLELGTEHDVPELPGGDLLILAGDTIVCRHLERKLTDEISVGKRAIYTDFFRRQVSKYEHALVLLGNHEHYGSIIEDTPDLYRDFLAEHAPHARLLDNETAHIGGWTFIGSTLWAPCERKSQPWIERYIADRMNDFRLIRTREMSRNDWSDGKSAAAILVQGRRLTTADIRARHNRSVRWIRGAVAAADRAIVITHHAPSIRSSTKYQMVGSIDGDHLTSAYCSNQDKWIKIYPQIAYWVHGHTHVQADYTIGSTRVMTNQRGYIGREIIADQFNPAAGEFNLREIVRV